MIKYLTVGSVAALGLIVYSIMPEKPPSIPVTPQWSANINGVGQSSPMVSDFNGDGVLDIAIGSGIYQPTGKDCYVYAVDGSSGQTLWRFSLPGDGFATPALLDITNDDRQDVFMGGRFNNIFAVDGRDGKEIWNLKNANAEKSFAPMNFNTPVFLSDRDGDNIKDLLLTQGGSHPDGQVIPSKLFVTSSRSGKILETWTLPDQEESYSVPVVLDEGAPINLVVGSGGERRGGHIFGLHLDKNHKISEKWRWPSPKKGIISSPLVHYAAGAARGVVAVTFDGKVVHLDIHTGKPLWTREFLGYETYASPAIAQTAQGPTVVAQLSKGTFPVYQESIIVWLDLNDGKIIHKEAFGIFNSSSPLTLDYNGDGYDDTLALTNLESSLGPTTKNQLVIYSGKNFSKLIKQSSTGFVASTPNIADLRGDGATSIIMAQWDHLKKLSISRKVGSIGWNQFRGPSFDGRYIKKDL